jgi:type II secretory pathway pseudopilin PulG
VFMKRHLSGFSLVEVVIAAVIVATTVGALFAVSSMTIRLTTQGQDRIIGAELARQGLEIVRQIRDANFVSDFCGSLAPATDSTAPCGNWKYGIVENPSRELTTTETRGIDTLATQSLPHRLVAVSLNNQPCTDYVSRNTETGEYTTSRTEQGLSGQVFCRRIFIEPIDPADEHALSQTTVKEGHEALRVRAQIAWLGYGRNAWRTNFANPECEDGGTEWCTEQVMVLTNWRPQR